MSSTTDPASTMAKHILYDASVSNNGARCRIILYKKQIPEHEVSVVSPTVLGGLKTPKFLELNPQGKMPTLKITDTGVSIPESDTICRYLLHHYPNGPSFQLDNPKSNLLARKHDLYLTTIQGCMYKAKPPFGIYGTRKDALVEYRRQLNILNDFIDDDDVGSGMYLCGADVSLADATLFPTMIFTQYMLPKFDVPEDEVLPPKIKAWFTEVQKDEAFAKVYNEVMSGLQKWDSNGRWDTVWLAGLRDEDPPTLFDKIVRKEIPATIVREDEKIIAFKDINPAAPAHVLVIPKDRDGVTSLRASSVEHVEILGKLMVAAGEIAKDSTLGFGDGARIVINDGPDGGQEIAHLHIHVLGGRKMEWPPG